MLKKFIWIIFFISIIILFSYAFYRDYKAKQRSCELAFYGEIEEIKICTRGVYEIKIKNDTWYYLGMTVLYKIVPIEVGDTIIKEKGCYKVILIKNSTHYNIGNDWKTLCDCESNAP